MTTNSPKKIILIDSGYGACVVVLADTVRLGNSVVPPVLPSVKKIWLLNHIINKEGFIKNFLGHSII